MLMSALTPLSELENAAEFRARHLGPNETDEAHMLSVIGAASRRALIEAVVPRSIALLASFGCGGVSESSSLARSATVMYGCCPCTAAQADAAMRASPFWLRHLASSHSFEPWVGLGI